MISLSELDLACGAKVSVTLLPAGGTHIRIANCGPYAARYRLVNSLARVSLELSDATLLPLEAMLLPRAGATHIARRTDRKATTLAVTVLAETQTPVPPPAKPRIATIAAQLPNDSTSRG